MQERQNEPGSGQVRPLGRPAPRSDGRSVRASQTAFDTVVMVDDEASLLESAKTAPAMVAVVDLSLAPGGSLRW